MRHTDSIGFWTLLLLATPPLATSQAAPQVEPTKPLPAEPLRYVTMAAPAVPAIEFDTATGHFIEQVLAKLSDDHIEETNLSRIWAELREERANPEISLFRKFEALLGADPGEADADAVQGK